MPANTPSSRRIAAKRPGSQRGAAVATKSASGRRPAPRGNAKPDADDANEERRPGRRSPVEHKPSKAPWIIGILIVLGVAAGFSYKPIKRSLLLGELDAASGAEGIAVADRYLLFEKSRESAVRNVIASQRGNFETQLYMSRSIVSLSCIVALAERGDLDPAQLTQTLVTGVEIYDNEAHRRERMPRDLGTWAEKHEDRDLANAALALLVRHAKASNDDEDVTALLSRLASDPAQDPLRSKAALDGLALLVDSDTLGHALAILRGPNADQALAHGNLCSAIRSSARAGHLIELLGLSDHPLEGVRALALDCMGRLTLPDTTDPKMRQDLGERVSAKLVASTPPVELAAALGAVKNLRLTGASEAVIALARQRETLALPGIDDQFWIHCLGDAFILVSPESAHAASDKLIMRLAEGVDDPQLRVVAGGALGRVREASFISLRAGMDALARHLDEAICRESLLTLVSKTYGRDDVVKSCGDDPARWVDFLAKDRPRFQRIAEIRAYVLENRANQRISDGRQKLGEIKTFLDTARDELQALLDSADFVAPLGLSKKQIEDLFRDVQELNVSVRKAYSGAL